MIRIDNVEELAKEYNQQVAPMSIPRVGEGNIYHQNQYNLWPAGGVLPGINLGLYIFGRVDWGFRMLRASVKEEAGPPEPMI